MDSSGMWDSWTRGAEGQRRPARTCGIGVERQSQMPGGPTPGGVTHRARWKARPRVPPSRLQVPEQHGPVENTDYLAALVAGQQVSAIACERPGDVQVFYARTTSCGPGGEGAI
jgi:hypothetical protein